MDYRLLAVAVLFLAACSNPPNQVGRLTFDSRAEPHPGCEPDAVRVVLKADDLGADEDLAEVPSGWARFLQYIMDDGALTADVGVITDSLEGGGELYGEQVRRLYAHPRIHLWHHGWDHEMALPKCEFTLYDQAEQTRRLQAGLEAAEAVGVTLEGFGAPCNQISELTGQALTEAGISLWYYGLPDDPRSIRRIGRLEATPGSPAPLEDVIAEFPREGYAVLQIHPAGWDGGEFEQFEESMAWIRSQNVCFVNGPGLLSGQD